MVRQQGWLRLYGPLLRRVLRAADRIIATSPRYIETSPWLRPVREKCVVVPLGVDVRRFAPPTTPYDGSPNLLFVGKLRYYKGLDDLLRECEVISLHAGLTPETEGMIGREQLDLISDDAVLVNTARGGIFDEQALTEKLAEGNIRAALDVFVKEPLPEDHTLRTMPNVIVAPHMAGATADTDRRVGEAVVGDAELFFSGREPENRLTKDMIRRTT